MVSFFAPEGSGAKIVVVCSPKWMNKKFAFTVVQKEPKKMELIEASRTLDVMIANVSF